MEDDPPAYRYTTFPNLHATTSTSNTVTLNYGPFPLPENCPKETIILAWALFLRGHAPSDSVVFRVDAQDVNIGFETGQVQYLPNGQVEMPAEDKEAGRFSAVYFLGVSVFVSPNWCF